VSISVLFTSLLITLMSASGSMSADNGVAKSNDLFGLDAGRSCYNYTFIDSRSIRGTLLEKEEMDSSPGKPDSVNYDAVRNVCRPMKALQLGVTDEAGPLSGQTGDTDVLTTESELLPNPQIAFIEDEKLNYSQFQSKDTIFYGGLLPFVAVHDADLQTNDHFINPQSVSLFLYFKRKF